jgi:hypothetical protein
MCQMEGNTGDFPLSAATDMCLRLCGSVCREGVGRVESYGSSALNCALIHRTSQKGFPANFVLTAFSEVRSMHRPRSAVIFRRMRRPVLVSTAMLSAIFLLAGCGGGGVSQAQKKHHAYPSHGGTLALHPEGDSGVQGTATFEDVSKGSRVRLQLRGLPKPNKFYLAHIHPGTCSQGEQEEEKYHAGRGGAGAAEEIEWPLMPVRSGTHGDGSSTTTLKNTTTEELFSGRPKHVNVHAAGSGNPHALACANLQSRSSSPVKTVEEATTPQPTSPTPEGASSSTAAAASASASSRGGGPSEEQAKRLAEADCRVAIYVAQEKMSRQKAQAFSELLGEMIRTMESLSWPEGILRNAALDHLGVPRYPECKKA